MGSDREVRRLRIRTSLLLGFLAIVVLMSAVTWVVLGQCRVVRRSFDLLGRIDTVEQALLECRRQEKNFLLRHDQASLDAHATAFDTLLSGMGFLDAGVRRGGIGAKIAVLEGAVVDYRTAFLGLEPSRFDDSEHDAERAKTVMVSKARECHALVAEIKGTITSRLESAEAMTRVVSILSIVIGILLSILVAGFLTGRVVGPLESLRKLASRVSSGDIQDVDVEFRDMEMKIFRNRETYDLARSLQLMVTSLRLLVSSERGLMDDYHMTILVLVNKAVGPGGWAVIERARAEAGFGSFADVQPGNVQRFLAELSGQLGGVIPVERADRLKTAIEELKA